MIPFWQRIQLTTVPKLPSVEQLFQPHILQSILRQRHSFVRKRSLKKYSNDLPFLPKVLLFTRIHERYVLFRINDKKKILDCGISQTAFDTFIDIIDGCRCGRTCLCKLIQKMLLHEFHSIQIEFVQCQSVYFTFVAFSI